jgi:hypothetical protein
MYLIYFFFWDILFFILGSGAGIGSNSVPHGWIASSLPLESHLQPFSAFSYFLDRVSCFFAKGRLHIS